jgi:hypothetical protein
LRVLVHLLDRGSEFIPLTHEGSDVSTLFRTQNLIGF